MWFDTANFYGPSLVLAAQTYDPHKLMAGSDYPYFQDAKYTRAISYIRDSALDDDATTRVLSRNAGEFFED
ncbi:amidohydrolase family protein [Rothia terrae]|uniref:amidohydrolase family protein n=1 Tax=Rothia terrae TaxID=396015 RepID=UPI0033FD4D7A